MSQTTTRTIFGNLACALISILLLRDGTYGSLGVIVLYDHYGTSKYSSPEITGDQGIL